MMIKKHDLKEMVEKSILQDKTLKRIVGNDEYIIRPGTIAIIRYHYDPVLEMRLVGAHRRIPYKYTRRFQKAVFDIHEIYKELKKAHEKNEEEIREIEEL